MCPTDLCACVAAAAAFVRGEPESDDNDAAWLLKFYETFKVRAPSG